MKYAVYVPPHGPFADARTLANLARDAEEAGWDGFFMWDHMAMWRSPWEPVVDPWVALAAVAMSTSRVRLGPMVTPVARRRPWKLARETASLDHLSGGRLTLGVGLGDSRYEFDDLGEEADRKVRAAMLDEGLEVLTGLWSGEPFSYDGAYYTVTDARFRPTPAQTPRIPIWVAGLWPAKAPFRRAARWDGVFPLLAEDGPRDMSVQEHRAMLDYILARRESDAPFDVVHAYGNPEDAPTRRPDLVVQYASVGVTWWFESFDPWRFGWRDEGPWPLEAMRAGILAGPPPAL